MGNYYTGTNDQYGQQDAFLQYLEGQQQTNPYTGQVTDPMNMNIQEPINTFDASQSFKDRLKKQRQTISPIRQYENDTLQYDITTGTGKYDFNPYFKGLNTLAQGATFLANQKNEVDQRRDERNKYLQALIPKPQFNQYEDGLNNIPIYKDGGKKKNEPTAEKARKILHDGKAHGKPLTDKQRKFFGAVINKHQDGGEVEFKSGGKKETKQAAAWRILREGKDGHGNKLTDKQKKFFLAMGRAKFPDGGINTTNIDPGWGNPKYGPALPNFGGDPGWGMPGDPRFENIDPGWGNPAFYPKQEQININGQWVPQAILDYKALQSNSISSSKGTTNLGWDMINNWAQKAFKNPRYIQSAIAEENDNDWYHNVDDIPFVNNNSFNQQQMLEDLFPETYDRNKMTPLNRENSKYFPMDEVFDNNQMAQYSFSPVRVDYNKKYIPYYQEPEQYQAPVYSIPEVYNVNTPTAQQPVYIQPTPPQPIQGRKIFLDPNNPTMAAPQNDIWNNPNGSNPTTSPYERKGTGSVADWFKDGGQVGEEIELTKEQIKSLQAQGYKFEIL